MAWYPNLFKSLFVFGHPQQFHYVLLSQFCIKFGYDTSFPKFFWMPVNREAIAGPLFEYTQKLEKLGNS